MGTLTGAKPVVSMFGVWATTLLARCSQVTQTSRPRATRMSLSPPLPPWSSLVALTGADQLPPKSSEKATKMGLLAWLDCIQDA